jgi:hypothetical protein
MSDRRAVVSPRGQELAVQISALFGISRDTAGTNGAPDMPAATPAA